MMIFDYWLNEELDDVFEEIWLELWRCEVWKQQLEEMQRSSTR